VATQARDPRYDPFAGFDWGAWMLPTMSPHCDPDVVQQHGFTASMQLRADLTGDQVPDYLVVGECPSLTSGWPEVAEVVDGSSTPSTLGSLGIVTQGLYWRTLEATTKKHGKTVQLVLSGQVIGDGDSLVQPTHFDLTLQFKNGAFTVVSKTDRRI
jgi:hypothetical protein